MGYMKFPPLRAGVLKYATKEYEMSGRRLIKSGQNIVRDGEKSTKADFWLVDCHASWLIHLNWWRTGVTSRKMRGGGGGGEGRTFSSRARLIASVVDTLNLPFWRTAWSRQCVGRLQRGLKEWGVQENNHLFQTLVVYVSTWPTRGRSPGGYSYVAAVHTYLDIF